MKKHSNGLNLERSEPAQPRRHLKCPECKGTLFLYTPENGQSTCQFCGFNIPVGRPEPDAHSGQVGW